MNVQSAGAAVAEIGALDSDQQVFDIAAVPGQERWGYSVGLMQTPANGNLPSYGNTAVLNVAPEGMIGPLLIARLAHTARLHVSVLAGQGSVVRAFTSGGTERQDIEAGAEFSVRDWEAIACVNTGGEALILRSEATPAFKSEHFIPLLQPYARSRRPGHKIEKPVHRRDEDGKITDTLVLTRTVDAPDRFYDLLGEVASGVARAWRYKR